MERVLHAGLDLYFWLGNSIPLLREKSIDKFGSAPWPSAFSQTQARLSSLSRFLLRFGVRSAEWSGGPPGSFPSEMLTPGLGGAILLPHLSLDPPHTPAPLQNKNKVKSKGRAAQVIVEREPERRDFFIRSLDNLHISSTR
jgi:hypothetical protein